MCFGGTSPAFPRLPTSCQIGGRLLKQPLEELGRMVCARGHEVLLGFSEMTAVEEMLAKAKPKAKWGDLKQQRSLTSGGLYKVQVRRCCVRRR